MEIDKSELRQLLDEAVTRELIDSYRFSDRLIVVETQQGERELSHREAKQYLRSLFQDTA